jgi:hypothetical protein
MTGSTHTYLNLINSGLVTYKLLPLKIQGFSYGITNESILISIERNKCANEILHFWSLQRFGETHHLCPQPGFLEFLRPPTGRPRSGSTF